jgi:DNA-directed RNA polymerase specialized sigma24 family protein
MGEITQLLDQARSGDSLARDRFFSRIYAELDRLAKQRLARQSPLTMLDAAGLVHEVYLRLSQQAQLPGADRRAPAIPAPHRALRGRAGTNRRECRSAA